MQPMAYAFQREGYEAHSWGYPSRDKTIQEHAGSLVQELQVTAERNPNEPIHFVTHSLGGIIVRAALNHPDCPKEAKIGRAVLLGPPNQGSRFGGTMNNFKPVQKLFGKKAGRELLQGETFDYIGQFPNSMEVLVIAGTFGWNPFVGELNDGLVGVKESRLKTPHQQMIVFSGHAWIMYSDTIINYAVKFISSSTG